MKAVLHPEHGREHCHIGAAIQSMKWAPEKSCLNKWERALTLLTSCYTLNEQSVIQKNVR